MHFLTISCELRQVSEEGVADLDFSVSRLSYTSVLLL